MSAPDQPVVTYSGLQGDATDFDLTEAIADAHRIWFGNFFNSAVWLYYGDTLERIPVHGLAGGAASIIDLADHCS